MKKTTLILAGIALIAASCAKTEVVSSGPDVAEKGISFSAYTARPTKAQEDVTTDNLTSFQATAIGNSVVYFDNVTFTKRATYWESDPAYFWPVYSLDFYAYNTPAHGTFTRKLDANSHAITFSPSTTLSEQEDLVAASATGQSAPSALNGAIDLRFHHYLTQVIVKAQCSNTNYTVKVDGVKLANLAGEGTYTFSTTTGSAGTMVAPDEKVNSEQSVDYSADFTSSVELSSNLSSELGKWYLVPQEVQPWDRENNMTNKGVSSSSSSTTSTYDHGTYLALKVSITMKNSNSSNSNQIAIYPKGESTSAWMAVPVPSDLAFAQGKKYNVTVDFFSNDNNGGAGYVDPEEPGELDGDEDTDDSGKAIVGGVIKFNATVDTWDNNKVDITISL